MAQPVECGERMNYTIIASITKLVDTKYDDRDIPYPVVNKKIIYIVVDLFDVFKTIQNLEEMAADWGDGYTDAKVLAVHDEKFNDMPIGSEYYQYEEVYA